MLSGEASCRVACASRARAVRWHCAFHRLTSQFAVKITPGGVFHLDFGVLEREYCSDLQRCWYVPRNGETAPPPDIQRAFDTVVHAITRAAEVLKPGASGWEVDAAARSTLTEAGYP